jgi:hypothetical protein
MEMTERFGLRVSGASAAAVDEYVGAVDLLLSANVGADAGLERALGADPNFAVAHIACARLLPLQAGNGERESRRPDLTLAAIGRKPISPSAGSTKMPSCASRRQV